MSLKLRTILERLFLAILLLALSACAARHIQPSEPGWTEKGVASWYGSDFNGKPTASGETYNMYAMTAAHKDLPLGSIVKVTNLENGRHAKVVINDRGPFVAGRIIDLSFSAAKAIGITASGTAIVRIELLGRESRYVRAITVEDTGPGGHYTVQLGAFVETDNAERLKTVLEWKHPGAYIMKAEVSGKTFFRVRIGKGSTKDVAVGLARALAEEGYPVIVLGE
jgi:peptidoglycan lytic transglycosylase